MLVKLFRYIIINWLQYVAFPSCSVTEARKVPVEWYSHCFFRVNCDYVIVNCDYMITFSRVNQIHYLPKKLFCDPEA